MKIKSLKILNFRGIKEANLLFDGHSLLLGGNNVGKSTICEALDLVLGPDRLNRFPPVEEYDFYNGVYLSSDGDPPVIEIEVVIIALSDEIRRVCGNHLEIWHKTENRLIKEGEIDNVDQAGEICLRLIAKGWYEKEEDEFDAATFFAHSPDESEGKLTKVSKNIKRSIGFLYLRTLRTGSRALSLERGSLLDIILRTMKIRSGLWEETRERLKGLSPPIQQGADELLAVLKKIEARLTKYIQFAPSERATDLFVSNLTREHLRKTISFFLKVSNDQSPVPYQQVGTGTLNTLVLALLTFLAELKNDDVIFAMEEPEIALPPHTQRRIASYLLTKTSQCFVTTHSPYVIEQFSPEQITILKREDSGLVHGRKVTLSELKSKTYRKHIRKAIAEALLSRGVIIGEGITEICALQAAVSILEKSNPTRVPFDLLGISFLSSDGDGSLVEFAEFFKAMEIPTFGFYDNKKNRSATEKEQLQNCFDINNPIEYYGMEDLLVNEIGSDLLWQFLQKVKEYSDNDRHGVPNERPGDDT